MKPSLLVFALFFCTASHAEVYKWIDADGKVQYGDSPPKNANAKVVSGGVTVVPAIVVPKAVATPPAQAATTPDDGGRGSDARKADDKSGQSSVSASQAAAAQAEARAKAIERCKSDRRTDCESGTDAQPNAKPTVGFGADGFEMWRKQTDQPANRPDSKAAPKPVPPTSKETPPAATANKPDSQSGPSATRPIR
jgi:hypothetical protein